MYYADIYAVCNWQNGGSEFKFDFNEQGKLRSNFGMLPGTITNYFFKPGVTYPRRTHSMAPQAMPSDTIISVRGQGVYAIPSSNRSTEEQNLLNLAVLASRAFDYMLKLGLGFSARPQFDNGAVNRTPFPTALQLPTSASVVAELVV